MIKRIVAGMLVLMAIGIGSGRALAGGYLEIHPLAVPERVTVGERAEFTFALTGHDGVPMREMSPGLILRQGNLRIEVDAVEAGAPGHYRARVVVPQAGRWSGTIDARFCGHTRATPPIEAVAAR